MPETGESENNMSTLATGIQYFLDNPLVLALMFLGVFLGIVFGAIPGLTAALAVSLALPFTYGMLPQEGILLLIALYVGGISGGLTSAILLNIPGSPASLVTCFDGSPMAKQGRQGEALAIGVLASLLGGLFSAVALILIAPQLAKVALVFGPWEYFTMGIMGLAVVVSLCSQDLVKGFIGAIIGLLIASVGMDPVSGVSRFTFGIWQMDAGLGNLPVLMGLFAFAEILSQLNSLRQKYNILSLKGMRVLPKKEHFTSFVPTYLLSAVIGTVIGILPGVGQSTASLLAYNEARSISKQPEKFGTGCEEGVIASETANNAVCGGALIPMMTMGIPGDTVTAILLGGLVVHGMQPGPLLFSTNQEMVGVMFVAYILSNIAMFILMMLLMKVFIRLLSVPMRYMFPFLLLMCMVGTYTVNNRLFDTWVLFVIGIAAYILVNCGFSLPPIVLGYVLGSIIESNFRTAMIGANGNVGELFTRPIALGLLAVAVLMVALPSIKRAKERKKAKNEERGRYG